ncbi:glycosyl transferase [Leptolyngbya sp. NIES-2104]|nr:glycosyl transferase [Leptolyngbya sp. NIES-2104]
MTNLQGKRILVVTSVYPQTETARHGSFVREANLRLLPLGVRFTVFAPAFEGSQSHVLDGIRVHRFRYCPKRFENLARDGAPHKINKNPFYLIVAALYIVLGALQLFWVCWREKPDLLQVHWPFPHGLMAFPVNRLLNIPMVFTFHGTELLLSRKFKFVSTVLRWLLPYTSGVTANSGFTAALIQKLSPELFGRTIDIIPYGLTVEAKPSQTCEIPRILFAGRLLERKGLQYLLRALPLILRERAVRLRVAGDGDCRELFQTLARELEIDHAVDFLGLLGREALAEEYATCSVFVLPAIVDDKGETEGLGIVMIEALAHAKPVVATPVGGITDIVTSGRNGFLVPERNAMALAEVILKLLADPELAATLGSQGQQDVQYRFSWSRIVPLWQQVFENALMR